MKKTIIGLLCLVFAFTILISSAAGAEDSENLLKNGSFETLDEEGLPEDWMTDAFTLDPGYTVFSVREGEEGHGLIAEINNIGLNDARFAQDVSVEPDSLYRLSGYVMAEGITEGHGANLSVEGVYAFSEEFFDTDGKWEYIEYYGETGPDQYTITVFARLGGYSGESAGKAWFDDLKLTKVEAVPGDDIADFWFVNTDDSGSEYDDESDDDTTPAPAWPFLLLTTGIYLFAAFAAIRVYKAEPVPELKEEHAAHPAAVFLILAVSFILRLILSYFVQGYMVDVNCFLSWGHTMATHGPGEFYQATNFCDYPPLYTYVLGLNSFAADVMNAGTAATRVIFRFIPSLCDVIACWLLYRYLTQQRVFSKQQSLCFLLFLAFNPATILNSAAWGQMDSVLCLILLAVAILAIRGQWMAALPLYMLSVLIKPQALMLGPLGLIYIILTYVKEKDKRKQILIGCGISILVFLAGVIPFSPGQTTLWIFELYARTLASYPYATVNTANFYYILGGNWAGVNNAAHVLAPILLSLVTLAYGAWWYFRSKNDQFRLAETIISGVFALWFLLCTFIGASWALIGGTAMGFAFVIVISHALRYRDIRLLTYLGGLLFILLYVFGVKMHERYLFPAILLLAASWITLRDRRILYVLLAFTATLFLNEGIVLDNSIRLGSELGHLNRDTVWLADIISLANILGAIYAVYLSIELCHGEKAKPAKENKPILPLRIRDTEEQARVFTPDRSLHWKRKDTLIVAAVTAIYAVISLLTLGSTKAPQNAWISTEADEQVVFDLGETQKDFSILYFAQVSRHDFSFAVSDDAENWSEEVWAQMDQGQCWKWKYVTQSHDSGSDSRQYYNSDLNYVYRFSGRYVRLTAAQVGLTLNEIIFRGRSGQTIPAAILSRSNANEESELYSDPSALLDEQYTLEGLPNLFSGSGAESEPAQPSWWNSTYFDEIYHARTAFEFLKGTVPYETSHPPLGKVIMSLFVAVFGMTPFGWRFAGALAGILMLPGMYLLGKQLTKKTSIAFCACMLMALDCMHLTQTQIATIDSFPVLFIIFSYFFMLRFLQTDPYREPMRGVLLNLAFSGLFMGLAAASKWIGIYAGAGLAILFFWHCIRIFHYHRKQADAVSGKAAKNKKASTAFKQGLSDRQADLHRLLMICLWCVLFFVIVPIMIYLVSYIPYFAYNSKRIKTLGDYIREVWNAQIGMLNYHGTKNLGMDHPFYSPWWEWPIIGKPMYYAAEQYIPDSSAFHHSIFCFGNPVIWYGGLAALLYALVRWAGTKRYQLSGSPQLWHLSSFSFDPRYAFLFIGGLAQYLPWVLVPRGTYIYHYFASLPFLMLAFSACFDGYAEKHTKIIRILICVLLILAAASFVLLFPYASGISAPEWWLGIGKKILRIWY